MAEITDNGDNESAEKRLNNEVSAVVLCELNVSEHTAKSEKCERDDVVKEYAEHLAAHIGNPAYIGKSEDELNYGMNKSGSKTGTYTAVNGQHNDRSH